MSCWSLAAAAHHTKGEAARLWLIEQGEVARLRLLKLFCIHDGAKPLMTVSFPMSMLTILIDINTLIMPKFLRHMRAKACQP
jgi:hypothetical protein